ncbi:MAG TPA: alpha/beta hydrolase [Lysobacter sp.]
MRITRHLPAAIAAALLLTSCSGGTPPAAKAESAIRHYGRIAFEPCSLASPLAANSIEARCATFAVAENPAAPGGRKIKLNLAWLPATEEGAASADPVFFLAGGPGQAATEHAATVAATLRDARKHRHIVLVDQRGTGKLSPLACRDDAGKDLVPANSSNTSDTSAAAIAEFAGRCAQAIAGTADARYYTTTEAVGDLDTVRAALGVARINLMGVSYGTRVAQQYAARHPQHTRTLVLDGVAPNPLVVGGEFARTFERALELQSENCRKLPDCKVRFGTDLRAQLRNLKTRLAVAPVEVEYRDPDTGESKRDTLTADTVVGLTHIFSYMPQMASLLPMVIDEADRGRYAPLMALAKMMERNVEGQMTRGMQWSVICTEDADRYRADPADAGTVLGDDMGDAFFAACKAWPRGERPADFNRPLQSNVPALLLSGEIDPVTPPAYGDAVLKGLPNGRHLVLRGQGHNVSGIGCLPKLLGQFIESADAKTLDAGCLAPIGYVPPFTSFNGWEP